MIRSITATLALLVCSWTAESQAGSMQLVLSGMSPFDGKSPEFSMSERDRKLCISPCFSKGAAGYIAEYIFVPRNDLVDFSPRFFPSLLPDSFTYPGQSKILTSNHKDDRKDNDKDNDKDKDKDKDNHKDKSSGGPLPPLPTGPQITDGDDVPPPGPQDRMFTAVVEVNQVPVPATLALFGLGLAGMAWSRRKKT